LQFIKSSHAENAYWTFFFAIVRCDNLSFMKEIQLSF